MDTFDYFAGGSYFMFELIPIFSSLIFIFVFACIIITVIRGISEWSNNNKQPILDVNCKVISKRTDITRNSGHHDANGHYIGGTSSTNYYVTFEFESKDRMEFKVNGSQYGMLSENDYGKLKFQGTRFLDFSRQ